MWLFAGNSYKFKVGSKLAAQTWYTYVRQATKGKQDLRVSLVTVVVVVVVNAVVNESLEHTVFCLFPIKKKPNILSCTYNDRNDKLAHAPALRGGGG